MKNKLNQQKVYSGLSANVKHVIAGIHVHDSVSSTNDYVMRLSETDTDKFVVCVANQQMAGKGRNGRQWLSPADANIYMSIGCHFDLSITSQLSGLSLVCGVAVCRKLEALGLMPEIKWPNDILINSRKLAGILIETRVKSDHVYVVIGIGLNVKMPEIEENKIDQPWIDLHQALDAGSKMMHSSVYDGEIVDSGIDRNLLTAMMLEAVVDACMLYRQSGFMTFADDWQRFDVLAGKEVVVKMKSGEHKVKVLGLDTNCALRVLLDNKETLLYAADIKLKLNEHTGN